MGRFRETDDYDRPRDRGRGGRDQYDDRGRGGGGRGRDDYDRYEDDDYEYYSEEEESPYRSPPPRRGAVDRDPPKRAGRAPPPRSRSYSRRRDPSPERDESRERDQSRSPEPPPARRQEEKSRSPRRRKNAFSEAPAAAAPLSAEASAPIVERAAAPQPAFYAPQKMPNIKMPGTEHRASLADFAPEVKADLTIEVRSSLVEILMTSDNKALLEETGCHVEWDPDKSKVDLIGNAEHLEKAKRLLNRVNTHCLWGQNAEKVKRLLKPLYLESVLCRLSPMDASLPPYRKQMSSNATISIGKGPENDLIIPNKYQVVSRSHCVFELDNDRGAVYVIDSSTNGTWLNSVRLPQASQGKVLLSHGDELSFTDPAASGVRECGYIINLTNPVMREEQKFDAPRRIASTWHDGPTIVKPDFG